MKSIYKRVLIKLSGEALSSPGKTIDYDKLDAVVEALGRISRAGVQMGLVVGGGNIFRGRSSGEMNRTDAPTTWACWPPSSTPWPSRTLCCAAA